MSYPEKFTGVAIMDVKDWQHPKTVKFDPKVLGDHDVDVKVECCGVCGSDHHGSTGLWGEQPYPYVAGHEVIGRVVKLGPKCDSGLKIGDRVGIGAQVGSCMECDRCKNNNESYCPKIVWTMASTYPDGYISKGGFANYIRLHEHYAIPIPDDLESAEAAPLMCGGVTVFSPLYRNGCGPGKKVGILGIGGIGHMGILFAKAMGAEVYAISRSSKKKEDAIKLGADHFIATKEEKDWAQKYFDTLDLLVICAGSLTEIDFDALPKIMKIGGRMVSISVPENHERIELKPLGLLGASIHASSIGSPMELRELLKLVSEKKIKPWVEKVPISEEGLATVYDRMNKGDVRFRFTMVDYDKHFGE